MSSEKDEITEIETRPAEISAAEGARLLRKIDFKLLPILTTLFLLSFLDRTNIGQAKLSGLIEDLRLTSNQYSIVLIIFFVGYVSTEILSNLLLKRIRPSRMIPIAMICWATIMICMGLVKNFGGLAATRILLGLFESVLFPGIGYYLACWYPRDKLNLRISIFFSSATLSGAFGGLLAYLISKMDGLSNRGGWSWIFIIEGTITLLVGIASIWLIQDFPSESTFLEPEEKVNWLELLRKDQGAAGDIPYHRKHVVNAFLDWKTYTFMLIYISSAMPLYSLSLFIPTIISSLGVYTRAQSQLLSTPPFFVAFFVTISSALLSDRVKNRGYFNAFWLSIAGVGFIILLSINPTKSPGLAYFALFLATAGISPPISNTITWAGNTFGPIYKKSASLGAMFVLGNSGGIVASEVFATGGPRFRQGHASCLAFVLMGVILSLGLGEYFRRENNRRDMLFGTADSSLERPDEEDKEEIKKYEAQIERWNFNGLSTLEIQALGDSHPGFRYIC